MAENTTETKPEKYTLTEEHRAQLKPWADKWIAIALRTDPSTEQDQSSMRSAMDGLYKAAKLEVPELRVFCPSPISAAVGASVAAGVWWLRENPDEQKKLFERTFDEHELAINAAQACRNVVTKGMKALIMAEADPERAVVTAVEVAQEAAQLKDPQGDIHDTLIEFFTGCTSGFWRIRNGGNQWAGWVAYLSFFRHIVKLDLPEYENFQHYEAAAVHGGPRFMHVKFWVVSDFPTFIGKDEQNRSHCDTGPAIAWRDGWKVYSVHGVRVPMDVVENPNGIGAKRIQDESNAEVRRVMLEKYGEARYLTECDGALIHEDGWGKLYRMERKDDVPLVMVRVQDHTADDKGVRQVYWLKVHPELRPLLRGKDEPGGLLLGEPQTMTAKNAVASTFGKRGEEYNPTQMA